MSKTGNWVLTLEEEFYEKCNEIKSELMESSKLEVRGNQL